MLSLYLSSSTSCSASLPDLVFPTLRQAKKIIFAETLKPLLDLNTVFENSTKNVHYSMWRSCHLFDLFKMDRHGINQKYKI